MGKRVISEDFVAREHAAGRRTIAAPRGEVVITPSAYSKARELGVSFEGGEPARSPREGRAERVQDPSGITVVRGDSVRLGSFPAAGPGREVQLLDLITGRDGSPMSAGIMSWKREDSFPWRLDYDEIDLVLEGVLRVEIDGRTIEARKGDVVRIPKGSSIVFGTPSSVKVFYVTYPAEWAK